MKVFVALFWFPCTPLTCGTSSHGKLNIVTLRLQTERKSDEEEAERGKEDDSDSDSEDEGPDEAAAREALEKVKEEVSVESMKWCRRERVTDGPTSRSTPTRAQSGRIAWMRWRTGTSGPFPYSNQRMILKPSLQLHQSRQRDHVSAHPRPHRGARICYRGAYVR